MITYAKHSIAGFPKIVLIGTHADCFPAVCISQCFLTCIDVLPKKFDRFLTIETFSILVWEYLQLNDEIYKGKSKQMISKV